MLEEGSVAPSYARGAQTGFRGLVKQLRSFTTFRAHGCCLQMQSRGLGTEGQSENVGTALRRPSPRPATQTRACGAAGASSQAPSLISIVPFPERLDLDSGHGDTCLLGMLVPTWGHLSLRDPEPTQGHLSVRDLVPTGTLVC